MHRYAARTTYTLSAQKTYTGTYTAYTRRDLHAAEGVYLPPAVCPPGRYKINNRGGTMTDTGSLTDAWLQQLFDAPPIPSYPPSVPVCACGVHMYALDSQDASMCIVCRNRDAKAIS